MASNWKEFKAEFLEAYEKSNGKPFPSFKSFKREKKFAIAAIAGFAVFGTCYLVASSIAPNCDRATAEYERWAEKRDKATNQADFTDALGRATTAYSEKVKACR